MNKDIILKAVEDSILRSNLIVKCSVHSTKAFHEAIQYMAGKYGLEVVTGKMGERPTTLLNTDEFNGQPMSVVLMDKKNNTFIQFSKRFINQDYLDYKGTGDKNVDLEDIFKAYDQLPTKNKKSMNLITFDKGTEEDEKSGTLGKSTLIDPMYRATHSIFIPDYLFNGKNYDHSIDFVLAHESMHTRDYPNISQKNYDRLVDIINGKINGYDDLKFLVKYNNINASQDGKKFKQTFGGFKDAVEENASILRQTNSEEALVQLMNHCSDYGLVTDMPYEDYADAGAMVINGWKNLDNPSATVQYMGKQTNFREWLVFHAPQAKYLIKDLYGEDVELADLVALGASG